MSQDFSEEYLTAVAQAKAIRKYWIGRGYEGIVVRLEKISIRDPITHEHMDSYKIVSNVIGGLPPKKARVNGQV